MRFLNAFKRIVTHYENSRISLGEYAVTLYAIIFVRLLVETFSDNRGNFAEYMHYYIHYPLFFTLSFCGFALILRDFTGQDMSKILKALLPFFTLILVTPIVDLLFYGGGDINYFIGPPYRIFHSYLNFYGMDGLNEGVTPGMRVQIALMILSAAGYVWIKTRSAFKTIMSALTCYSLLFALGWMPQVLSSVSNHFAATGEGIGLFYSQTLGVARKPSNYISMLLFPMVASAVAACFSALDVKKTKSFTSTMFSRGQLSRAVILCLGIWLGYAQFPEIFSLKQPMMYLLFLNMILCVLFTGAASKTAEYIKQKIEFHGLDKDDMKVMLHACMLFSLMPALIVSYPFFCLILSYHAFTAINLSKVFDLWKSRHAGSVIAGLKSVLLIWMGYVAVNPKGNLYNLPSTVNTATVIVLILAAIIAWRSEKD